MTEPTLTLGIDVWDLDRLRLPAERVGNLETRRRPPRHWPGDPFIKGPIPHAWIASACRLPGAGLAVAMGYRFLCCRFRWRNRWGLDAIANGLRVTSRSARRGLHSAEMAGLLAVEREPGCKLAVSVLDLPDPEAGSGRRPLHGPIPWSWWLPASRLPGRSLQVASVCWLLAGWSRSADFELALDGWSEFGLSRFSASRGLDTLERAGLVCADRRRGLSPTVSIVDRRD
jgi:DNA-binding transcriptional ArsR family regulator